MEIHDKHRRATGGCLSRVLILYLAKAFSYQPKLNDHNYHRKSPEPPLQTNIYRIDHAYSKPINIINLLSSMHRTQMTEWAVTGSRHVIENGRVCTLPLLEQHQLQNNTTRGEEYSGYPLMYLANAARSWVICLILKKTSNEERSWRLMQ